MTYKHVAIEMQRNGSWSRLGAVSEVEPPASISNDEPNGRQIYMFGWYEGDGPCVWRSTGGADLANDVTREITTMGLEKLADVARSPYEMKFWRNGLSMPIRFREVS